jgi:hypothetical protein
MIAPYMSIGVCLDEHAGEQPPTPTAKADNVSAWVHYGSLAIWSDTPANLRAMAAAFNDAADKLEAAREEVRRQIELTQEARIEVWEAL